MTIEEVASQFAIKAYKGFLARKETNYRGCYIPNKQPRGDGYVRFSVTAGSSVSAFGKTCGERTFYIHHLAWYATGRPIPKDSRSEQISHLCADSRCFNIDHLIIETPKQNNSRKNCKVIVTCPCPCKHTFFVCEHVPMCIPH